MNGLSFLIFINGLFCFAAGLELECGLHEVVNECASQCVNEPSCQNPNPVQEEGTACATVCVKRCECDAKNGWIRSSPDGPCIQTVDCQPLKCGLNEVVNECASLCIVEPSCQNPILTQEPAKTNCPAVCIKRCECDAKNGWVRSSPKGPCIQQTDCHAGECGLNEVVNECASKCIVEPTCQNPNPTQEPGTACPEVCEKRCQCDSTNGWIRSSPKGPCIQKTACQTTCPTEGCGPNEILTECASSCIDEPTCQIPNPVQEPGTVCNKMCVKRCECDANNGWIRATSKGPCVPKASCQFGECGPHEILTECASSCLGEATCQIPNPVQEPGTVCNKMCIKRCECDANNGWIRATSKGPCVPKSDCQCGGCGPNEVLNECASNCIDEATCQNPNPILEPGTVCNQMCVKRCECDANNGWIRATSKGPCVAKSTCRSKECPKFEEMGCASCCQEPTCQDPKPTCPITKCPRICLLRCKCQNGLIRESESGKCVPVEECPTTQS